MIQTSCEKCVFAEFDDQAQIGCRLGRIQKFVKQGTAVRLVEEAERPYCVIDGLCMACRRSDGDWAAASTPDNYADRVRSEMRLRLHVVVPVSEGDTIEDVVKTVDSLEKQTLPPRCVRIPVYGKHISPAALDSRFRDLGPSLVWKLHVLTEPATCNEAIDIALKPVDPRECLYYSVFKPGFMVPRTFVADLDHAINEDLTRFLVLTPNAAGQGLTVQLGLYRSIGGNSPAWRDIEGKKSIDATAVEDKIRLMCEEDGRLDMIKKVEELCPDLA